MPMSYYVYIKETKDPLKEDHMDTKLLAALNPLLASNKEYLAISSIIFTVEDAHQ